jgi:predicted 3-demethylubiquinone-9 3-methyltransferase (glyoxalase superfamily)
MYTGGRKAGQKITPMFLFVGNVSGKAEEAIRFYTSFFRNARVGDIMRYGKGEEPDKEGTVRYADFTLEGTGFAAMDSAHKHEFTFNEAISFVIHCHDQQEIEYYWGKLSAVPEAEQCGWLKDKYGVSWQVTPAALGKMLADKDPAKVQRVTQAFLKMKKFDVAVLEAAYRGL